MGTVAACAVRETLARRAATAFSPQHSEGGRRRDGMAVDSTGEPLDRTSDTSSAAMDSIMLADLAQIESQAIVQAIAMGDVFAVRRYVETTAEPIPLGLWRKLKRWAEGAGDPAPWTFTAAAMIEAAIAGDPLPAEPANLRSALLELDPQDFNSWWQVLIPTDVHRYRSTCFLLCRLIEHHLGTTWATSIRSLDVRQWDIPTLDPIAAFDDTNAVPHTLPCWITRPADTNQRRWQNPVFAKSQRDTEPYAYTGSQSDLSILMLSNTVVFGQAGIITFGNRRPHWHGLKYLGYDYNGILVGEVIAVTLDKLDRAVAVSLDNILMICDPFNGNYYHCLLDYVTRLAYTEFLVRDHQFLIGIPSAQAGMMVPILEALGFGDSVLVLDQTPTVFQTVAVAAATQREPYCHPDALRWLRDRVRAQVPPRPARRLLISRQDASARRVVNEAELCDALADFGFERVVPSTLNPAEQLGLFASAEVIVAPHGAALASLVACAASAKVVEIAANLTPSICFTQISNLFGFDHVLVRAEAVGDDLAVGVADVLAALSALGVEPQRGRHP